MKSLFDFVPVCVCICATIKVDRNFNLCIYLNDLWPEIQMHKLFFLELTTSFNQIYWIAFCQCERRPSMNQMIDCIRSFFCSTIRHAFSSLNKIAAKKILFFPFGRSLTHSHHNKHYFLYILPSLSSHELRVLSNARSKWNWMPAYLFIENSDYTSFWFFN